MIFTEASVYTKKSLRIKPPSYLTKYKWCIEDFNAKKIFAVSEFLVCILFYCIQPKKISDLLVVCEQYSISENNFLHLIKLMLNKEFLVKEIEKPQKNNSDLFNEKYLTWKELDWGAAAEYHFFTFDYAFLDYSTGAEGAFIAHERMKSYSENEPDVDRVKIYNDNFPKIPINSSIQYPPEEVNSLCTSLRNDRDKISLQKLSFIISLCLEKTGEVNIHWKGAPLIRKTSPSGGSRHPTEGYLIALDNTELDNGLYHIQSHPLNLVKLEKKKEVFELQKYFPELFSNSLTPAFIIILTSLFERNMFRYREPRTFRSVHIDVGHVISNLELVAHNVGLKTLVSHNINEKNLEEMIGINGLIEGVLSSVGFYG